MPVDPNLILPGIGVVTFGSFAIIVTVVGILILAVFVLVIVAVVRNLRKVRQSGHDPLTLQADLATRALDSELLSPARTVEERLGELDSLKQRNLISETEYSTARAQVLSGR